MNADEGSSVNSANRCAMEGLRGSVSASTATHRGSAEPRRTLECTACGDSIRRSSRSTFSFPPLAGVHRFPGHSGAARHAIARCEDSRARNRVSGGRSSEPSDGPPPSFGAQDRTPSRIRSLALALRLPPSGLRLGHDALRYASLPLNRPRLEAAFKPYDLDVLHAINGGYPGATSALAAVLAGRRSARHSVMTVCSTAMPRSILEPVERRVDRRLAGSLDAVVVPAQSGLLRPWWLVTFRARR